MAWFTGGAGENIIEGFTNDGMVGDFTGEGFMMGLDLDIEGDIGDVNQNVSIGGSNWQPNYDPFQQHQQGPQYYTPPPGFALEDRSATTQLVTPTGGALHQAGFFTSGTSSGGFQYSDPLSNMPSENSLDAMASQIPSEAPTAKTNRKNRRSPQNNTSTTRGSVKKQRASPRKFNPGNIIAHLERAEKDLRFCSLLPAPSKHKFDILLRQFKLLVEEADLQRKLTKSQSPSQQSVESTRTSSIAESIFSATRFSTSQSGDLSLETEDSTDTSSTLCQTVDEASKQNLVDSKSEKGPDTIFWCTKKGCGYSIQSEVDWKRHEQNETHWPQGGFMCCQCPETEWSQGGKPSCSFCSSSFTTSDGLQLHYLDCESAKKTGRTFGRKDHFCKHLREKHFIKETAHLADTWKYSISSKWPRQCGYCGYIFQNWNQRMKHIADHYRKGAKFKDWKLPFPRRIGSSKKFDSHQSDSDSNDDNDEDFGKMPQEQSKGSSKQGNSTNLPPTGQSIPQGEGHGYSQSHQGFGIGCQRAAIVESLFESDEPYNRGDDTIPMQSSVALQRYLNDNEDRTASLASSISMFGNRTEERPHSEYVPTSPLFYSSTMTTQRRSTDGVYSQKWLGSGPWVPLAVESGASESILETTAPALTIAPTLTNDECQNVVENEILCSGKSQFIQQPEPSRDASERLRSNSPGGWECLSISSNGRQRVERMESDNNLRKGRRLGPLNLEKGKRVAQVRQRGACCQCRLNKVPCDLGIPCNSCTKMQESPWRGRLCIIERLVNYTRLFLPDVITSHYSMTSIETLIIESTLGFTKNAICVQMTSGPKYPPIVLQVHEFVPRNMNILLFNYMRPPITDVQKTLFASAFAPPIGVSQTNLGSLRGECLDHVKTVSKMPRDIAETTDGCTATMVWRIINAVIEFQGKAKDFLLYKATMLYTMNYFMSRLFLLTHDSIKRVIASLQQPAPNTGYKNGTSKLINVQIKHQIQVLLEDNYGLVLERLETVSMNVKGRNKTWASSFCTVVILCTCIEAVQEAIDEVVVSMLRKKEKPKFSRQHYFFKLEDVVFNHCVELFHNAYKTRKAMTQRGFNPIRDGLEVDSGKGITKPMVDLVVEVKVIIFSHEDEMKVRAKDPSFDTEPDLLKYHEEFRKKNSGRLVSRFLLSFLKY